MVTRGVEYIVTFSKEQPQSLLLGFVASDESNFRELAVTVSSKHVLSELVKSIQYKLTLLLASQLVLQNLK